MDHLSHSKTFIDPIVSRDQGKNKLSAVPTAMHVQLFLAAEFPDVLLCMTPYPMVCPVYIFFKKKKHEEV